MRTFLNQIKNETLDEIKTSLENLWQRMIQLSEFFQYLFVVVLKRKCLVGASRVRCGESGTPSTIIYTRWSSRRYKLGCDAPVGKILYLKYFSLFSPSEFFLEPNHAGNPFNVKKSDWYRNCNDKDKMISWLIFIMGIHLHGRWSLHWSIALWDPCVASNAPYQEFLWVPAHSQYTPTENIIKLCHQNAMVFFLTITTLHIQWKAT